MDNLYYVLLTNLVIVFSLICITVLVTVHLVKKRKFNLFSYLILSICVVGMYLYVPSRYVHLGFVNQNPQMLKKAIKFSINPYEKRLCNLFLADIYAKPIYEIGLKDGNKAIYYMEKALNGEYKKYSGVTRHLAYLYSIKGDYQKTEELNNILGDKQSLSLRNIYILNNEYKKAVMTFSQDNISVENYLKASLYKKLGNTKLAIQAEKIAIKTYNYQLENIKETSKKQEYRESVNKYRTIEAYKSWLKQEARNYKFI